LDPTESRRDQECAYESLDIGRGPTEDQDKSSTFEVGEPDVERGRLQDANGVAVVNQSRDRGLAGQQRRRHRCPRVESLDGAAISSARASLAVYLTITTTATSFPFWSCTPVAAMDDVTPREPMAVLIAVNSAGAAT